MPASDLAFADTLPSGITIATPASAFTDCTNAVLSAPDGGTTITFSGGTLGAGPATSCTASVNVAGTMTGMNTSSSLTGMIGGMGASGSPASATLTVSDGRPGFSKAFSPAIIPQGGTSTLTFTIDNNDEVPKSFLSFTDPLTAGMVIATSAGASNTCGGTLTAVPGTSLINLNGGFLAGGSSCTTTVDVTTTTNGVFVNTTLDLTSGDPAVSSGFATDSLNVPIDNLIKSFTDDPVAPGDTVTLEFTIVNLDRVNSATDIEFDDDLDATLTDLVALGLPLSNPCGTGSSLSQSGMGFLSLTGGTLPPEGSCTFSATLQVPSDATPGSYTNTTTAIMLDLNGMPFTGNTATDILVVQPRPLLTKEFLDAVTMASDPVVGAGDDVLIQFEITNTSSTSGATGIAFVDELTDGTLTGGGPTGGFLPFPVTVTLPPTPDPPCGMGSSLSLISLGDDRQGLSLTGGILAADGMCSFTVSLSLPTGLTTGTYVNTTGVITATVGAEPLEGDPASDTLDVVAAPSLFKEFTDDPVQPGSTATLQFTLTHDPDAPGDATGITFTDDLAALASAIAGLTATGLPLSNICGNGSMLAGSVGDTLLTFTDGALSPGDSCMFSVTLSVPGGATPPEATPTPPVTLRPLCWEQRPWRMQPQTISRSRV